jgi:hypothetical protein
MKKFLFTLLACLTLASNFVYADTQVEKAYHDKQNNVQVQGVGKVSKILSDDNNGIRHQKFLLKLPSKLTLLVAHNIDLSKKIDNLKEGDDVEFYGEYEWNNKGGIVHWTHHDPSKKHKDGWLKHKNVVYK